MANSNNYWTHQRPDGTWATKREGGTNASSVSPTQAEEWERNKELARESGGEAFLTNREHKIRERNTYGNDPRKTKG
ncbi:hypothetical protein OAN307_c22340 [Octadecabacter antarcticus 307]|uniref:DUF2188 family protein n=1 Tax=Octadecabacter antarcticus 307 TaxID=391626 RepID=M9R7W5_9RHOB|nr:DUF2188 domain-containing protein [Octadecabacter antarcticus]AGI67858.1 hypothetical protein OAN307_c22340 [Octadecabacter antarcticus 307]